MEKAIINTSIGRVTLRKRGEIWYARKQAKKEIYDFPLGTRNLEDAIDLAQEMVPAKILGIMAFRCDEGAIPRDKHYRVLFNKSKSRAKTNGVSYELTAADEEAIIARASGCCELTGVPFSLAGNKNSFRAPYRPSLDRIMPTAPYTFGNSRLVCVAVNWALSDWGVGVFDRIASAYAAKKLLGQLSKIEDKNS